MAEILKSRYPGVRKWQLRLFVLFVDALLSVSTLFRRKSSVKADHSKILVIRLDHIGDCIMAIPLIKEIKRRFPESALHLLCNTEVIPLLEPLHEIDKFYPYSAPWFNDTGESLLARIRAFLKLSRQIKAERYDIGIDLRGDLRHIVLMRLAGVRRCVGYGITGGGPLLDDAVNYEYNDHMVIQDLKTLKPLTGEFPKPSYPSLALAEDGVAAVERIIKDNLPLGERFVGIQAVARLKYKWWEPEKFAILADLIKKELGYTVVFIGSKGEREYIEGIMSQCRERHIDMAGFFTLRQFPIFLSRLSAVVGCDSGPMHMAAAVGTPTLTIFGSVDPKRSRPFGDEELHRVVQFKGLECVPCNTRFCDIDFACLKMLTVEDVFREFKNIELKIVESTTQKVV